MFSMSRLSPDLKGLSKLKMQISEILSEVVLVSLLLTLNRSTSSSSIFIVNFDQINVCWDDNDNNNSDNSHD